MQPKIQEWGRVPQEMRAAIEEYVVGLTLFGAIAAGVFDRERQSAANVLMLGRTDLALLRRFAEYGPKLGAAGVAAPLVMTPAYLDASHDTFPLELLEIHQNHVTLWGDDPFADLALDPAHLRLQCERELKTMLIRMRQGLLAATGRERELEATMRDVANGLARTTRGMLWLHDDREARPVAQVIERLESTIGRQLHGMRRVADAGAALNWDVFEALYGDIETLGEVADGW
jgi:hypothetical protein